MILMRTAGCAYMLVGKESTEATNTNLLLAAKQRRGIEPSPLPLLPGDPLEAHWFRASREDGFKMRATSSTEARNTASFAFEGLLKPLIFLTYWSEAARISSGVTGGSQLKSILIFRHILADLIGIRTRELGDG